MNIAPFKFELGQTVHVNHNLGPSWTGEVLSHASTDGTSEGNEYVVSNGPELLPGIPLYLWEHELSLKD